MKPGLTEYDKRQALKELTDEINLTSDKIADCLKCIEKYEYDYQVLDTIDIDCEIAWARKGLILGRIIYYRHLVDEYELKLDVMRAREERLM